MIIVAVDLPQLLFAVQRHVRGAHVDHQPRRSALVAGNGLLDQHLVQRPRLRPRGPRLQSTECRRTGRRLITAHGRLHHPILAQPGVIVRSSSPQHSPYKRCASSARNECRIRLVSRGSLSFAVAMRVSPMRRSTCRTSISPPSLDSSPPEKSASITRRPSCPKSIRLPAHFGLAKSPSNNSQLLGKPQAMEGSLPNS